MDGKIKTALSRICGLLSILLENYGIILTLCCAFILIDLVTGLVKAKIQGTVNSDTGYKGFWRKAAMLAALVFGIFLDIFISYVGSLGLVSITMPSPVGRMLALYIAINECISICENLFACGVKMPKFLINSLRNSTRNIPPENSHHEKRHK